MAGIDGAARAFSADMNGGKAQDSSETPAVIGIDEVFPGRSHENDVLAGGDDTPSEDEQRESAKPRRAKAKAAVEDEDIDPLYADDPEDEKPKKGNEDEAEEEDDDEAEEEDDPDKDDDEESVDLDPDLEVEVTVDGKAKKVSLREALEGYIRTDTFHTRLNELNNVKTVMQKEARTLIQHRGDVVKIGKQLEEDLKALAPPEPDWDKLFAEDPANARALQKTFTDFKAKLEAIRTARTEQETAAAQENAAYITNFANTEKERFESLPENAHWKSDPKKQERDIAAMVKTARAVGFTDDEIRGTLDSRMLAVLLRASKYDRLTANRPKVVRNGIKPAKPRSGNAPLRPARTDRRGVSRAQQQLQKSGSIDDAANVFQRLI